VVAERAEGREKTWMNATTLPRPRAAVDSRPVYHPPRNARPRCEIAAEPIAAEILWAEYCALRDRAEASRDLADGRAAGMAWARFLSAFV
jgi:hypothetical protein